MPLLALLLAWLIPGAGHLYLRRWARGIIIMVVIGGTFWTGVAFGGVLTVDYNAERWWFYAQSLTGVHGLVGWHRQQQVYEQMGRDPKFIAAYERVGRESPAAQSQAVQGLVDEYMVAKGYALVTPTDTVARAYSGVAGLLNLMCIFDAVLLSLMGIRGEMPLPAGRQPPGEAQP